MCSLQQSEWPQHSQLLGESHLAGSPGNAHLSSGQAPQGGLLSHCLPCSGLMTKAGQYGGALQDEQLYLGVPNTESHHSP